MNTLKYSGLRNRVEELLYSHFPKNGINLSNVIRLLLFPHLDEIVDATQAASIVIQNYAVRRLKLQKFPFLTNCMAYQHDEDGPYSVRLCLPLNNTDFLNVVLVAENQEALMVTMSWPDGYLMDIAKLLSYLVFEIGIGDHTIWVDNEYEPVNVKHLAAYSLVQLVGMDNTGFMDYVKEVCRQGGNYEP